MSVYSLCLFDLHFDLLHHFMNTLSQSVWIRLFKHLSFMLNEKEDESIDDGVRERELGLGLHVIHPSNLATDELTGL